MFRHVVLFTWKENAGEAELERLAEELRALPGVIEEIRAFHVGADAGLKDGNYHFAVVADFDDPEGYYVYRDHPAHRVVVTEHVDPIVATRAAVQYYC